ncbi:MAG: O-antigen ligase family protein [Anaerolineae bacterium]
MKLTHPERIQVLAAPPPGSYRKHRRFGALVATLALGLLVLALYVAPNAAPYAVAVVGLGLPAVWLLWRYPEVGLVTLVLLTDTVVPSEMRFPATNIELRDLMLVGMLALLAVRGLWRRRLTLPWWRVSGPLLAFQAVALFSALYAVTYADVAPNLALNELRTAVYYTSFFIAAWGLVRRKEVQRLLIGLFLVANLTTAVVFLEQFPRTRDLVSLEATWYLGQQSETPTQLGAWYLAQQSDATAAFGSLRVVPPGHVLMYLMATVAFCLLIGNGQSRRVRLLCALELVFLGAGLLLTYTRAQWLASLTAFALAFLLLPSAYKKRAVQSAAVVMLGAVCIAGLSLGGIEAQANNIPFIGTLASRAVSVLSPADTLATDSLSWRLYETQTAVQSISEHPFVGVGLGGAYRHVTLFQDVGMGSADLTRFIHNAYLYIIVKMGFLGLVTFLWFYFAFLIWGWHDSQALRDGQAQTIAIAVVCAGVGLLQWSLTTPHFFSTESTVIVGVMVGTVAATLAMERA